MIPLAALNYPKLGMYFFGKLMLLDRKTMEKFLAP